MALVILDRVKETTNTTGYGTLTLAGAAFGFQSFALIGDGNSTYYAISSGSSWEVGIGTYTAIGTTLSRDTVFSSSAGGTNKISVSPGAIVFVTYPAEVATYQNTNGYATTVTSGATTTLNITSALQQFFTGTSTQSINLPVTSTLALGWNYSITNKSTGNLSVFSSGGNLVYTVLPQTTVMFTCVDTTLATSDAWNAGVTQFGSYTGSGSVVMNIAPFLANVLLSSGAAAAGNAPLKFTTGTKLTTPERGAMEYEGIVPFFTPFGTSRGVIPAEQLVILASPYTLSGTSALQKIFNVATNGAVTLEEGTYEFECCFALTSLSAGTGSISFAFGGGASISYSFTAIASKQTTLTTPTVSLMTMVYGTSNNAITVSNGNATCTAFVKGVVRVVTGGTLIPQLAMSSPSNAIVRPDSFFRIYPVSSNNGSGTVIVGNWS